MVEEGGPIATLSRCPLEDQLRGSEVWKPSNTFHSLVPSLSQSKISHTEHTHKHAVKALITNINSLLMSWDFGAELLYGSILHNTAWEPVYPKAYVIWQFSHQFRPGSLSPWSHTPSLATQALCIHALFPPQTHNSHFYSKIEEANCPPILNLFFSHMWPLMPFTRPLENRPHTNHVPL